MMVLKELLRYLVAAVVGVTWIDFSVKIANRFFPARLYPYVFVMIVFAPLLLWIAWDYWRPTGVIAVETIQNPPPLKPKRKKK